MCSHVAIGSCLYPPAACSRAASARRLHRYLQCFVWGYMPKTMAFAVFSTPAASRSFSHRPFIGMYSVSCGSLAENTLENDSCQRVRMTRAPMVGRPRYKRARTNQGTFSCTDTPWSALCCGLRNHDHVVCHQSCLSFCSARHLLSPLRGASLQALFAVLGCFDFQGSGL